MKPFVKMPSQRIRDQQSPVLRELKWSSDSRSDNIAALMLYIVMLQHMNAEADYRYDEPGFVSMSYSDFETITGLSRAKISGGISVLEKLKLIAVDRQGKTNVYKITDSAKEKGWAQLPYKSLYQGGNNIKAFQDFNLRKRTELDALKIYLLLIAFRDNKSNHATISYEKINQYTAIPVNLIRSALSFLVAHVLIQVDQRKSDDADNVKFTNYYRIVGISDRHFGNMNFNALENDI